ncbi:MAG: hypothetical protein ACO3FI_11365, partial [Cyclobacteriaceae bacterium]
MSDLTKRTDQVLQRSRAAFEIYRAVSGKKRAEFLDAVATAIESAGASIVTAAMKETNLPEPRLAG